MADKMAATFQSTLVDTLSHLIPDFYQISYMNYFHQALTQVGIWVWNDNQDGHLNGHCLYVCGHSYLVI